MTRRRQPLLDRLSAADPARAAEPDAAARDELWARISAQPHPDRDRDSHRRRLSRRTAGLALAAALAATTGALAATKVIRFGAPAKPTGEFSNPHRGIGSIRPHSVRLLAIRVPDPAGGPPWGMRLLSTTRGYGCVQVGRVLDGKLGALGRDHAFGDDGRFHPLPPSSVSSPPECGSLDANGRAFLNIRVDYIPASGIRSCMPPGFIHGGPPPQPICRAASQRSLQYGLLGPEAEGVTYTVGGRTRTQPTAGPEGAYLIVTRAKRQHHEDAISGGPLPFGGPITAIEYRDGSRCNIPSRGAPHPASACRLPGYAPPQSTPPTRAELTTPIRVRIRRSRNPRRRAVVEVSFRARVAVTSGRTAYTVSWSGSNERRTTHLVITQGDIRAGQVIRKRFAVSRQGLFRGEVRFISSSGPAAAPLPGLHRGALVGRWSARVR